MGPHCFVTIDAETEVIATGVRIISAIREEVEASEGAHIPLVWFVRFQRSWDEYVEGDRADLFEGPITGGYDGFALARGELLDLLDRGDEIGWHYHAYNYVHRSDLSHSTRLEILRTDLASCARELRARHPEFPVASFRFGWFFVPDYAIYDDLARLGISRDASINPSSDGGRVPNSSTPYLRPLADAPTRRGAVSLFPFVHTVLVHDWTVVAHDFGWSRFDEREAATQRDVLAGDLASLAARLKRSGGSFLTYASAGRC